jgi:hypothetical protein
MFRIAVYIVFVAAELEAEMHQKFVIMKLYTAGMPTAFSYTPPSLPPD